MRGMELLILFPQQMLQHLDQRASNIHTNTEQENSDFLTAPSLLMPLLPARLFRIPHITPVLPSATHFLQESNLFLTSPHILEAFPAGPTQVSSFQSRLIQGWDLLSHELPQAEAAGKGWKSYNCKGLN